MTQDEVIALAREAGFIDRNAHSSVIVRNSNGSWVSITDLLERLVELVEAKASATEREACAHLAEWEPCITHTPQRIAAAIRARCQQ